MEHAESLGVRGWIRNTRRRTVEGQIEADEEKLKQIEKQLWEKNSQLSATKKLLGSLQFELSQTCNVMDPESIEKSGLEEVFHDDSIMEVKEEEEDEEDEYENEEFEDHKDSLLKYSFVYKDFLKQDKYQKKTEFLWRSVIFIL